MLYLVGAIYFFSAGPGPVPVILHALDHFVDSHLSHNHEDGTQSDTEHHNNDHDHGPIFLGKPLPSVVLIQNFRLTSPEFFEIADLLVKSNSRFLVNFSQHRLRCADPPWIATETSFPSSFSNRAPPRV
ncbi:MAG: hypothetical protein ACKVQC_09630 [Elusimicrobiota bacterium]